MRQALLFTLLLVSRCQSWGDFGNPESKDTSRSGGVCTGPIASVTVTAGGTNFISLPAVTATGSGSGATFNALLTATTVASYTVTAPGSAYTGPVFSGSVSISGGGGTGASANATASYQIASYTVNAAGSGYQNGGPYPVPVRYTRSGKYYGLERRNQHSERACDR